MLLCLSSLWSFSCSDPVTLFEAPGWVWNEEIVSNQNKDVVISWTEEVASEDSECEKEVVFFSKKEKGGVWSDPKILASSRDFSSYPKILFDSQEDILSGWRDDDEDLFIFVKENSREKMALPVKDCSFDRFFEEFLVCLDGKVHLIGEGRFKEDSKQVIMSVSKENGVETLLEAGSSEEIMEDTLEVFQKDKHLLLVVQKRKFPVWSPSIPIPSGGRSLVYSWYKNGQWSSLEAVKENTPKGFCEKECFNGALNTQSVALVCWNLVERTKRDAPYKVQATFISEGKATVPVDLSPSSKDIIDTLIEIDDIGNAFVLMREKKGLFHFAYKPFGQDWMFLNHPFGPSCDYEYEEVVVKTDHEGNFILVFVGVVDGQKGIWGLLFSAETKKWSKAFPFFKEKSLKESDMMKSGMQHYSDQVQCILTEPGKGIISWIDSTIEYDFDAFAENSHWTVKEGNRSLKTAEFTY